MRATSRSANRTCARAGMRYGCSGPGAQCARRPRCWGCTKRSVQKRLAWYRAGGLDEVAAHRKAGKGTRARLSGEQQAALRAEAATGRFRTATEALSWVQERFGAVSTLSGMHQLLRRLHCKPKIPVPSPRTRRWRTRRPGKKGVRRRSARGWGDGEHRAGVGGQNCGWDCTAACAGCGRRWSQELAG